MTRNYMLTESWKVPVTESVQTDTKVTYRDWVKEGCQVGIGCSFFFRIRC
jgi:hypothetical protein